MVILILEMKEEILTVLVIVKAGKEEFKAKWSELRTYEKRRLN